VYKLGIETRCFATILVHPFEATRRIAADCTKLAPWNIAKVWRDTYDQALDILPRGLRPLATEETCRTLPVGTLLLAFTASVTFPRTETVVPNNSFNLFDQFS